MNRSVKESMLRPAYSIPPNDKKEDLLNHTLLSKENVGSNLLKSSMPKTPGSKLYKEYCISDLSKYKSKKLALRWRTESEVISGKGEVTCGNIVCCSTDRLRSWEVNFKYFENGQHQNALVKLRLCYKCSQKLNHYTNKKEECSDKQQISCEQRNDEECEKNFTKKSLFKNEKGKSECINNINSLWVNKTHKVVTIEESMSIYLSNIFE